MASRRSTSAGAVLRAVLDHGPVPRSTIARLTGMSPASVSGHTGDLLRAGLLREAPEAAGPKGVGRPHVPLDVDRDRHLVCGVHISVPHTTLSLLDLRGGIVRTEDEPHRGTDPGSVLARIVERLPGFLDGRAPLGVGLATGGWVDQDSGVVVEHPVLGWRDVPVRDLLATATGLPVGVDGHARALLRAENLFGQGRSRDSVLQLFVGNVVDAAFATGGAPHHGPRSAAGAVAHVPVPGSAEPCPCGRTGCLQAEVSERTLVRRALALGVITRPWFGDLLDAARAGNPLAHKLFRDRARWIGRAAALLLDVLNPEVLVLAEPGVSWFPECLEIVRTEVLAASSVCVDPGETVVPTSFRGAVLPVAAGAVVLDPLYADPAAHLGALALVS